MVSKGSDPDPDRDTYWKKIRAYPCSSVVNTPMEQFAIGQRWISEAEPELGLGLVVGLENRRVQLMFSASGEMRMYAAEHAPVRRVRFEVGDTVQGEGVEPFVVESIQENEGVRVYKGEGQTLLEAALSDVLSFDRPEDRLLSGHVDEPDLFQLRLETLHHRHDLCRSPVRGFVGGKVELIPHQLYIAAEVSSRPAPRVLLSDEVGLGKTIEACLILHRLLVLGRVRRVLILLPDPLMHQWFVELLRRFHLLFSLYDEERCAAVEEGGEHENPFLDEQLVLCPIEWLSGSEKRLKQAITAGWDLMIVDEAHHLHWSSEKASPEYCTVEALSRIVPSLLLLTATPEQMGLESHFARVRLLDPHRYPELGAFLEEREGFEKVAAQANRVLESGDESTLQDLVDRHGPGRVMFRNTRSAMPGFPKRHLHRVDLDPENPDAREEWLAAFLREDPKRKVLLICQTRREVKAIHRKLQVLIRVKTALFHEDLPLVQCDRQAAWFAEEDGARLLIASEIGGEGRNFQFVQHLILVNLPEDPEMLEQRIGRLDRIGQTGDIHIYVPTVPGSPAADRFRWYDQGLNAFEQPLVGGHEILLRFQARLGKVDEALIKETRTYHQQVIRSIEAGRDRLLELNSFRPEIAARWVDQIRSVQEDGALEDFLLKLFDHFGVHPEKLDEQDYLLVRGHTFDGAFPMKEERLLMTLSRARAIAREDMEFMSWDHPMVDGAMDLLLISGHGTCAVAQSQSLEQVAVKAVFLLEPVAPPGLGHDRWLPPTPIEVAIDLEGNPVDVAWTSLTACGRWEMPGDAAAFRSHISRVLDLARETAESEAKDIQKKASAELVQSMGQDVQRLEYLASVNDHVRAEEVETLKHRVLDVQEAVQQARIRLDSLLLVLPS
jgi:ATP-dependent helicase HepA